jgi:hypothetical protein
VEVNGYGYINVISQNLHRGTEENHKELYVVTSHLGPPVFQGGVLTPTLCFSVGGILKIGGLHLPSVTSTWRAEWLLIQSIGTQPNLETSHW